MKLKIKQCYSKGENYKMDSQELLDGIEYSDNEQNDLNITKILRELK